MAVLAASQLLCFLMGSPRCKSFGFPNPCLKWGLFPCEISACSSYFQHSFLFSGIPSYFQSLFSFYFLMVSNTLPGTGTTWHSPHLPCSHGFAGCPQLQGCSLSQQQSHLPGAAPLNLPGLGISTAVPSQPLSSQSCFLGRCKHHDPFLPKHSAGETEHLISKQTPWIFFFFIPCCSPSGCNNNN